MKHYILHRLVKLHRFINLLVIINAIVFAISILVFLVFKSQADNNSREIKRIYYLNRQVVQITALKRNADEEFSVYKLSKDAATQQRLNDLHEKISYSIESLPDITLKTREQQQNIEDLLGFENARQQVVKNFQFHNKADELQRDSAIYVQSAQNIDELLAKINDVENVLIDQLKAKETEWETFNGKILTIVVALGAFLLVLLALKINNDLYLRRKAEDKIRKSEARYKSLMENAGSVMYTTDIKGVITYASAKAADLTGYTNEQLIGKHFSFLLSPSDIAKLVDIYANQVRQNIKETVRELVIITQDGTTKWVEQVAILMKEGNHVIGFQCIVRDISDKKQMELELQKSAQNLKKSQYYLQAILDNTTSLMYIKDVSGRFVMANKRYKDLFGLADEQIINKTNYDFMSKEEADFYKKLDDEVIATKKPVEIEEIKETTIGKISLLSVKFPLLDNENDVFGVSGISTDITERANYQQKLIEAKQIAEEARKDAEEAKSMEEQFLANMSHEIRTPMNGIQGMTNLLLETELNGQQKEFATIIKRSVNNLLVIINDILDFSKIKAGKLTIEQADFSLQEVLDNIKAMFDHRVKKKELQFIFEADKTIPEVLVGDPFRLNQIIVNLVGNAIKFTEKGFVKIKISVLEKVGKQILLRFDVQDSGIGIASNEIGNIFESFTQANTSTTRLYGGTGLGLAISKKLAEMQGGKIWVESEKGVGSTFSFQIPYTINDSTTKPVPHLIGEVDYTQFFKDKQCLVVEDNEVNQKLIHYVLTKVGIKVAVANHGKEAIAFLEKNKYDLIIMDLQMPVMNGYETTQYIRQQMKLQTPIIAMTATVLKGEQEKCIQTGMNDYMSKPFDFGEFYRKVSNLFGMKINNEIQEQPKETTDMQLYDLSLLKELDDNQYLYDIMTMFVETSAVQVAELQDLVANKQWDKVAPAAHKLKGSTGMFQANELFKLYGKIETTAKQGDYTTAEDLVHQAVQLYKLVEESMQKELVILKQSLEG